MTRLFNVLMAIGIALIVTTTLVALVASGRQLIVVGSPPQVVVEYVAIEQAIKVSSKVDFANVHIVFDDLPGRFITVTELREIIKARLPVKAPEDSQ